MDIQVASTIVAPTGAGNVFEPWDLRGPKAEYIEKSPYAAAMPLKLTLTRTDPVPTKSYAGALRTQTKAMLQTVHPITGVHWPEVATLTFSHPAHLTNAEKVAFETRFLLACLNSTVRTFHQIGVVPQS